MSMETVRREVTLMLAQANLKIGEAEQALAGGSDREKVDAAGELAFLKRQKETLQNRLSEIASHSDAPDTVYQWLKEELFNLNLRLESWIAHG